MIAYEEFVELPNAVLNLAVEFLEGLVLEVNLLDHGPVHEEVLVYLL